MGLLSCIQLARSTFKDKKTSNLLKDLSFYISSGRHRAFSRHSATKLDLPVWGSLKLASFITGPTELSIKEGFQAEGFSGCSPSVSLEVPEEVFFSVGP